MNACCRGTHVGDRGTTEGDLAQRMLGLLLGFVDNVEPNRVLSGATCQFRSYQQRQELPWQGGFLR